MLQLPREYTVALEEVLGLRLIDDRPASKETRTKLARIARDVIQLSEGLTKSREEFVRSEYLRDEDQQQAYFLYYTTTNLLKLWPPLRELARSGFFANRSELHHLDLGTGTGAAIWGLATYLEREQPAISTLHADARDKLARNLRTVGQFASNLKMSLDLRVSTSQIDLTALAIAKDDRTFDLISLMNVLGEIDEMQDAEIIAFIDRSLAEHGAAIMIEPASREVSRRALRFRDRMVAAGFHVFSPCCRSGDCPALEDENNWCHTEIPWKRPGFIQTIDDVAGTLRLSLKATYAVFLREDVNLSDSFQAHRDLSSVGRVVSERFDEKGRHRGFICNELGRWEYVMNKRDKSTTNRPVTKLERYDLVQISGVEVREHDVKIGHESEVRVISNAECSGSVDNYG
ncbi:MAG: small ribosomal subunit Rsm22 family protein [Bacteroidota bacterium]|nr:small ribosomal subunit Rsm22 family protein [Bacteroidota bacterium]MDP4233198.1 small ribosomal subunit Rsm22 family protein [Bacteroidota bacterium]MDP4242183.1 small ribosomal subunit Rsm22 family protein [Bacteroidota bacterium]MDP4287834.1 small ribosomal subunit Rsm22 family protein [Bacteroidota bacterium]